MAALATRSQPPWKAETLSSGENKRRSPDDGVSGFMSVRPRLFRIAYRMLGNAAAAEDVVQDAWLRWQTVDRSVVRDAAAFLATTAARLAITSCSQHACAQSGPPRPVCPNRLTRAPTLSWERHVVRSWRREFCYC